MIVIGAFNFLLMEINWNPVRGVIIGLVIGIDCSWNYKGGVVSLPF